MACLMNFRGVTPILLRLKIRHEKLKERERKRKEGKREPSGLSCSTTNRKSVRVTGQCLIFKRSYGEDEDGLQYTGEWKCCNQLYRDIRKNP